MNKFTYLKDKNFSKGRYCTCASDVPTIALMNLKYGTTPLTLWETLTGRREPWTGNERTKAGTDLENIILKWGLEKLDNDNNIINDFLISRLKEKRNFKKTFYNFTEAKHPDYKFIISHADLIQTEKPYIMEGKSTGFFGGKRNDDLNFGYDKDDMSANGIPSSVYLQIQTQMMCYKIKTCYVSVMIDTGIHRLYGPIKAHVPTQEKILAICEKFWWHVENDKPPKPETWKDVILLNPNLDKESKTVIAGSNYEKVIEMKERKKFLAKRMKKDDSEIKDIKNAVGLILGKNAILEDAEGNGLASQSEITKYFLKNHKEMSKGRFDKMIKDGFISESTYRNIRV